MKGLSFSEPMVRAWMEGRKSVTRRIMNPQPKNLRASYPFAEGEGEPIWFDSPKLIKPPYLPGETVYIKETWCAQMNIFGQANAERTPFYKTDGERLPAMHKWRSPRFMPEWASRSHARIVSVRPERVQEITEEEAIKEGIKQLSFYQLLDQRQTDDRDHRIMGDFPPYYVRQFQTLWESLHPGSWESNSWVWRIELEKVK